jgi:hypothetical protein
MVIITTLEINYSDIYNKMMKGIVNNNNMNSNKNGDEGINYNNSNSRNNDTTKVNEIIIREDIDYNRIKNKLLVKISDKVIDSNLNEAPDNVINNNKQGNKDLGTNVNRINFNNSNLLCTPLLDSLLNQVGQFHKDIYFANEQKGDNDKSFLDPTPSFPHFKPCPRSVPRINGNYFNSHFVTTHYCDDVSQCSFKEFIPSSPYSPQFSDSFSSSHSFSSPSFPYPSQFNVPSTNSSSFRSNFTARNNNDNNSPPHSFHSPPHSLYSSDSSTHSAFIMGVVETTKLGPLLPFPKKVVQSNR